MLVSALQRRESRSALRAHILLGTSNTTQQKEEGEGSPTAHQRRIVVDQGRQGAQAFSHFLIGHRVFSPSRITSRRISATISEALSVGPKAAATPCANIPALSLCVTTEPPTTTGMHAPTLFQMGVEKGKAEREIGAAALNMYMAELDKGQDRSGPFTVVYENVYETDGDGGLVYNAMGDPKVIDRRRVQTFYRKSPEIMTYMDINNQLGFDKFTFEDSSTDEGGRNVTGLGDQYKAIQETSASRDRKRDYASYVGKGIDVMANFIMPTIIENKDTLTGFWGEVGRTYGPKYAAVQAILDGAVLDGMGGQAKLDAAYNRELDYMNDNNYIVNRAPDAYKMINGKKIGFFVDEKNEYGFNQNTDPDGTGGEPTWLATTDGMTRLLTNPNRSAMITFENTLGLMLSRDRQPTGRMLADILNRSFADTQMTSFGFGRGAEAVSPYQVLSNYTFIFNQLAKNRANALYDSGLTDDKNDTTKQYSPQNFKIQGIDKYVNSWYNLRSGSDGGMYATHDIYGQPTFGAWKQSITGNIILDQEEDKKASGDIVGDTMKFLTQ